MTSQPGKWLDMKMVNSKGIDNYEEVPEMMKFDYYRSS